jgi:hypothetical protein
MISLQPSKRIDRATGCIHRRKEIVVRVELAGILLKHRGQRWQSARLLPWAAAYDVAAKMFLADQKKAKAAARKARRSAR